MNICISEIVFFSKKIFPLKFTKFLYVVHKLCLDFWIVRWSLHSGFSINPCSGGMEGFSGNQGEGGSKDVLLDTLLPSHPLFLLCKALAGEDQARVITLGSSWGALRLVHTSPSDCSCAGKKNLFCCSQPPSPTF